MSAGQGAAELRGFVGLAQGDADVARQRIVARHAFIGAFEDDDVLLAAQRVDDGRFRERADDVDVDGADLRVALLAQVIACGLDVVRGATERDEHRVGIVALVLVNQAIMAAGQPAEFGVGVLQELQDGLVEIVAARHHAVHVVFLVLHRAEQDGIFQVHHFRHAPAFRAEQFALRGRGAFDDVVGRAEEFAEQIGFRRQVGALGVGGEHAVLDVHARVERQFVDLAEDDGLVGRLLGVLGDDHRPAGVERGVEIVVAAMDVERVLGQGAGADFEHHGGEFAGRVVILLHGIDDALAGSEIDRALAADRERRRAALRGMFAFGFDRDFLMAPDIQFTRA